MAFTQTHITSGFFFFLDSGINSTARHKIQFKGDD